MRNERKKLDLTQSELALKLNIAEITVRKIESGDRNPGMTMTKNMLIFLIKMLLIFFQIFFTFIRYETYQKIETGGGLINGTHSGSA
ncbi:hypothetical protein ATO00_03250 [Loigolactobacillus coryniformis subsp. coryniformis]|nr:hypothetical protein ATO00_03250 [Loigolactobacillus coryniformis subsp. coryniformis]